MQLHSCNGTHNYFTQDCLFVCQFTLASHWLHLHLLYLFHNTHYSDACFVLHVPDVRFSVCQLLLQNVQRHFQHILVYMCIRLPLHHQLLGVYQQSTCFGKLDIIKQKETK